MLKIRNLGKKFNNEYIFRNLNYDFKDNGLYSIIAPSGRGKTTLLNIISTIDKPSEGEVIFNSKKISKLNEKKKRSFRLNNVSFIYQSFNLFEDQSVKNNLALLLNDSSLFHISKKNERKIDSLLSKLNIIELKDKLVKNLSGGEKQRVAIARSLINNPKIIFADEPSGALDEENGENIFEILRNLSKDHLVIVVTHNIDLAYKYSDFILRLEPDTIINEELNNDQVKVNIFKETKKEKNNNKIKNYFKINYFKNTFKSKKFRMSFLISFLSISLLLSGLTFFLKDGLSKMISDTFEGLSNENSLILKRKEDDAEILSYYGASKEDVSAIYKNNISEVKRIGATYLNNIADYFPDEDIVEFAFNNFFNDKMLLEDYTANAFANFNYVETFKNVSYVYPQNLTKIGKNDVVIGISNEMMQKITSSIGIRQTYEALGNYIEENECYLLLNLKNNYWTYEDQVLLNLRGIVVSQNPIVYSNDFFFNEYLFEDIMMFPSSNILDKEEDYPWTLKKIYYFETIEEPSSLLNKLNKELEYKTYIFDNDKVMYNPNYASLSHLEDVPSNKVYVYQSLKKSIDMELIKNIEEKLNFRDYYYNTSGGYVNFSSIMSGFYNPTFFSLDIDKINTIIDGNKNLTLEEWYSLETSEGLASGNYLKQNNNSVKFSSKLNKSIDGRYPSSNYEIAISNGLAKLFRNNKDEDIINKTLYLTSIVDYKINDDETIVPTFKTIRLRISGIVDSSKAEIYHNNDLFLTLFRDLLNISSFRLNIDSITFLLDEKLSDEDIATLNTNLDEYEFYSPLNDINKTIHDTLSYIVLFLTIFSLFSIISSIILFSIYSFISFLEMRKEIAILALLGFSNYEIVKFFLFNNFLTSLISYLISSFSLTTISLFISLVLYQMFKIEISIYFSYLPFLIMFLLIVIFSFISIILILRPLSKLDFKKELH